MKEHVAVIVEGFKRLTAREKVVAYIEIEEDWKKLPKVKMKPKRPKVQPTRSFLP